MNFDFPDELKAMQAQASDYLKQTDSIGLARKVLDGETGLARRDWSEMAAMGWTGLTIGEDLGGNGIGYLALCLMAYEMGYFLSPTPFSSTLYLATEALLLAGSDTQKKAWLSGVADGALTGCFAKSEGLRDGSGYGIEAQVRNGRLTGVKKPVADGMGADFAIVVASIDGDEGLFLADLSHEGVIRAPVMTIEGIREYARIEFKDVPVEPLTSGDATVASLFDRAAVFFAFEQIGGAQACLDMGVEYARQRYAFGRPIGSFQAIKHKLADMFVAIELARSNAYYAAWALNTNAPELPVAAAAARLGATKAYWYSARENVQTHGGMGFTWQADCHLYYRRSKALSLAVGAHREWEDRLIDGLDAGLAQL